LHIVNTYSQTFDNKNEINEEKTAFKYRHILLEFISGVDYQMMSGPTIVHFLKKN